MPQTTRSVITFSKRDGGMPMPHLLDIQTRAFESLLVPDDVEGDLFEADLSKATVITLFLLPDINELDRAEGYGANGTVIVKEEGRVATGARLTYTAKNQSYLMTGTPVEAVETTPPDCKKSFGAVLTFQRAVDTIEMKGNGVVRAEQTKIACPGGTR